MWIYKHNLFHRDRPEDLYMVRRRTCPGLDGRKQRFSSRAKTTTKKADDSDEDSNPPVNDQHVIEESPSADSASGTMRKRNSLSSLTSAAEMETKSKRPRHEGPRRLSSSSSRTGSPIVDTSMLHSSKLLLAGEGEEDENSMDQKRNEKLEMLQQSMVVSDVAMKLEEYAKRARKSGLLASRNRRTGAGVVTPPFGSTSYPSGMSASELITYDDEYESADEGVRVTDLFGIRANSTSSVVTDSDLEEERLSESHLPEELLAAPVDMNLAKAITERLLESDVTSGAVAGFCMSTAPNGHPDLSRKILQLIGSCEALADDFHQYRSALKPVLHSSEPSNAVSGSPFRTVRMNHVQNWEREGSRSDAVRDFKVFSVNCVRKVLGKHGGSGIKFSIADSDRIALERTADVWLKSVGMTDQSKNQIKN